jgi:hypothetical protein
MRVARGGGFFEPTSWIENEVVTVLLYHNHSLEIQKLIVTALAVLTRSDILKGEESACGNDWRSCYPTGHLLRPIRHHCRQSHRLLHSYSA